jgi:hypothetical protein
MRVGFLPVVRNGGVCKTKWNLLVPDYRRISNSHKRIGTNEPVYWMMFAAEKREKKLPKAFNRQVWEAIDKWFGKRPQMNPLRVKDLLSPCDHEMLDIVNDEKDTHEVIHETMSKREEQQNLLFQTLSSSGMPTSSLDFCNTSPSTRKVVAHVLGATPTPVPGPTLSSSTPNSMQIINLSDVCSLGSRM